MVLGGANGPGTEEGCVGNEEEKELRHLKLTCGRDGKSLVHLLFDIKM